MGMYLVSVDDGEWREQREEDGDSLEARVEEALAEKGLALEVGAAPFQFEEKLYRDMGGFGVLVEEELGDGFVGLSAEVFVPVPFDGVLRARGAGVYGDELLIASSHTLLKQAQRLAAAIELREDIPRGDNLEIGMWFDENDDDNQAVYVALYLRAAEHSVAHRVPLMMT